MAEQIMAGRGLGMHDCLPISRTLLAAGPDTGQCQNLDGRQVDDCRQQPHFPGPDGDSRLRLDVLRAPILF